MIVFSIGGGEACRRPPLQGKEKGGVAGSSGDHIDSATEFDFYCGWIRRWWGRFI